MYIRIAQRLTASLALRPPPPLGYLSPFYDASDCREGSVGNREQEDEWRHTHAYEVIADFCHCLFLEDISSPRVLIIGRDAQHCDLQTFLCV